ncbi:MAG TPA: MG2 domain-containing protein, partial [Marinilabiliaceae bacterium]|nr:MG2 domain-containing protein [Marinilabiliaceae bacterium]
MKNLKTTLFPLILFVFILFLGCNRTKKSDEISHSDYNQHIAAFTSGTIPTTSFLVVEFTDSITSSKPGQKVPSSLLSIEPSLKGEWTWVNHKTIKFTPENRLPAGKKWKVTVKLNKLFKDAIDFFFEVATLQQNYRVFIDPVQPSENSDFKAYNITGRLEVADDITWQEAESIVSATLNQKNQAIEWQHSSGKSHAFEISNLSRKEEAQELIIHHDGSSIGASGSGQEKINLPSINVFSVQNVEVVQQPAQMVRIVFSDPLERNQNLEGLIQISNNSDFHYTQQENILEIHPTKTFEGALELTLFSGIRNIRGNDLSQGTYRTQVVFSSVKPAVEFIGKGNILPSSDHPIVHFKSVSLNSVVVRIVKIYENNVPHFLQINTINDNSQLKRAGRLIHQELLPLNEDATLNLNKWNSFAIDLRKMIEPDPGAIYRIELGFERGSSIYPCDDESESSERKHLTTPNDGDFWDDAESYYSDAPYDYSYWNWEERDNPCSDSYYQRSRYVSKNLLASNLGIIAKAGNNNEVHVFVTHLQTAQPTIGADVEILNFQMQSIAHAVTDSEGKSLLKTTGQPFLLIVKNEKQRGYLRLDDGQSLSLSKFDVSGQTIEKGIKGFIYGDRGVWRPGDSIFISFMPEDRLNHLPDNHPVTFEFINPRGQLIQKRTAHHPNNRLYTFKTATDEEAPTGTWQVRVGVGNIFFEKNLRIESIKPNRLKVDLAMPSIIYSNYDKSIELSSEWLHGASAAGLKAQVEMTIKTTTTHFQKHPNFSFDDTSREFESSQQIIFDGILNGAGKANFKLKPNFNQKAPGFVHLLFTNRVFEEGGSFSITSDKVLYSPYLSYVGLRAPQNGKNEYLLTDVDHEIEVITLNDKGDPINNSNLQYTIYKINWRWWWDRSDENLANYVSSHSANIIKTGKLTTSNGKSVIPFRINQPDWGRYLIRVEDKAGGHAASTTVLVDWPGWRQKDKETDAATMLVLNTEKEKYEIGEKATVTFPSSENSRALISLENGTEVIQSWWVNTKADNTQFTFDVTDELTPNIYISVTLLQPYSRNENDLPIRLYGITPITVFSPKSVLHPIIETNKDWKPLQKVEMTIKENNKQPMSYTLAIVDEGLLDITRFKTPSPWDYFNAREALGVKTWDIYDYVLGAYGGRIEQMFSVGGDLDLINPNAKKSQQRFEPMVRFLGPFDLKKGGKNKHSIELPNYSGSVRVMVVATNGIASGSAEETISVKQPLMVWAALPRVLGPNETVALPITIFSTEKEINKVKVEINTDNKVTVNGNTENIIEFDNEGDKTIYFELKANEMLGSSTIEITATSGKEVGKQIIHLPIRNPHPVSTTVKSAIIEAGKEAELKYSLPGSTSDTQSTLEFSVLGNINFGSRLAFLLNYPHGCVEQITSKAFPQLFLSDVTELTPAQVSQAKSNVKEVLNKLHNYQTPSGGLAYWSGGPTPDEWSTSYAGHFMIEAELKGYTINPSLKKQWVKYQKAMAASWIPDKSGRYAGHDFIQAYRLYTLALAGETHLSGMNRLRQQPNL